MIGDDTDEPTEIFRITVDKSHEWAKVLHDSVLKKITDESFETDNDNAHYCPEIAEHLLKECKTLTMWSCVSRNQFGFGRVPASSASAESQFNVLKNVTFSKSSLPLRVDEFIQTHVTDITGRYCILNAADALTTFSAKLPEQKVSFENKSCRICRREINNDENIDICSYCKDLRYDDLQNILSLGEVENWRGLGHEKETTVPVLQKEQKAERITKKESNKSLYLNRNYSESSFVENKIIKKIPLLKNGNLSSARPVTIGNQSVTMSNTCAFDSLFQVRGFLFLFLSV